MPCGRWHEHLHQLLIIYNLYHQEEVKYTLIEYVQTNYTNLIKVVTHSMFFGMVTSTILYIFPATGIASLCPINALSPLITSLPLVDSLFPTHTKIIKTHEISSLVSIFPFFSTNTHLFFLNFVSLKFSLFLGSW